jgi:molybdopterin molybdotransferase
MKPGKPLAHGQLGGAPFFGLPGNPVSCMVNFLLFVRPVIRAMLGDAKPYPRVRLARWGVPVKRSPGRIELLRVRLEEQESGEALAFPAGGQGSAHLHAMASADGFAVVPADVTLAEGPVRVVMLEGRGSAEAPRLS